MKILVTKNAFIAGSDWKKGTILEAPDHAAKAAIENGFADCGEALQKAIKEKSNKNKKFSSE